VFPTRTTAGYPGTIANPTHVLTVEHENGKQRRRSHALTFAPDPLHWRRDKKQFARHQAHDPAQPHQTIVKIPPRMEKQTTLQEEQWRGMKTWLQEKEEMRDM